MISSLQSLRRTEDNIKIILALIEADLSEEECLAKDKFQLTALHYAAALGSLYHRLRDDGYILNLRTRRCWATAGQQYLYFVQRYVALFGELHRKAVPEGSSKMR